MVHIPFFGKKKEAPKPTVSASSRVRELSSRGYSEPEIIRMLREEGYSPIEIDRALKTTMKSAASEEMLPPLPGDVEEPKMGLEEEFPIEKEAPQRPRGFDWMDVDKPREGDLGLPPVPGGLTGRPVEQVPPRRPPEPIEPEIPKIPTKGRSEAIDKKELEEMVESIIEEKWNLLEKDIGEINGRFEAVDEKIKKLEEAIQRIQELRKTERDEIKSNLAAYRESVAEMTMKIDSIEKAMKDTLTPMLQTLRSMSEAIKSIKK